MCQQHTAQEFEAHIAPAAPRAHRNIRCVLRRLTSFISLVNGSSCASRVLGPVRASPTRSDAVGAEKGLANAAWKARKPWICGA